MELPLLCDIMVCGTERDEKMVSQELRRFSLSPSSKEGLIRRLCRKLQDKSEVLFAFIYGSFLEGEFRDIDLGIFLDETRVPTEKHLDYQLNLLEELASLTDYPLDLRVLNGAPLVFRYNVAGGRLLFARDDEFAANFIERTWDEYLDFQGVIEKHLQEFARG